MIKSSVHIDLNNDFKTITGHSFLKFDFISENSKSNILKSITERVKKHLEPENLLKNNDAYKKDKIIAAINDFFNENDLNAESNDFSFSDSGYKFSIKTEQLRPSKKHRGTRKRP